MSELVEIKAEALKWCPNWFPFSVVGGSRICRLRFWSQNRPRFCTFDENTKKKDKSMAYVFPQDNIQVNPKEYEQAVIQKAELFIGKVRSIRKDRRGIFALFGSSPYGVQVLFDPRPWEEEYTIEIKEE